MAKKSLPQRGDSRKSIKLMLYVFVFALMVVAGVAVFAAVHMLAVLALSVLASVFAAIGTALTAVATLVVTVATVALSAAAYAVTTLAAVAVRMVVIVALVRALPWVWRAAVALYRNRDGLLVVAKGLALAAVVVGCFLGAILVAPLVLAGCCTVLPQVGVAAGVLGGAVGLMKVG